MLQVSRPPLCTSTLSSVSHIACGRIFLRQPFFSQKRRTDEVRLANTNLSCNVPTFFSTLAPSCSARAKQPRKRLSTRTISLRAFRLVTFRRFQKRSLTPFLVTNSVAIFPHATEQHPQTQKNPKTPPTKNRTKPSSQPHPRKKPRGKGGSLSTTLKCHITLENPRFQIEKRLRAAFSCSALYRSFLLL
jgi:hypothetical protein